MFTSKFTDTVVSVSGSQQYSDDKCFAGYSDCLLIFAPDKYYYYYKYLVPSIPGTNTRH